MFNKVKYLIPFLTSFSATVIFVLLGIRLGKKMSWVQRTGERHIHSGGALRIGGVAMTTGFVLAILINRDLVITPGLWGTMFAAIALMIAGIKDDLREVFWKNQLFYQGAAAILIFAAGVRIYFIANPLTGEIINFNSGTGVIISAFLVIFWVVLMINSMNWIDGIDGLSGGVTFIGALTIFFLSLKSEVNQPPMAILSVILAGTALAFLIFNFHPGRIMAGTSGSNFMGFALAVLAIFAGTKVATAVLVMSLPLIDFLWVIGGRLKKGKSIFHPDRSHLHHKLIKLGWSQKKTVLYFYVATVTLSIVALNTRATGKIMVLLAAAAIACATRLFISRKFDHGTEKQIES